MTIKKGDWVWLHNAESAVQAYNEDICVHLNSQIKEGIASELTPYASIDEVRVGDRCVVVSRLVNGPKRGTVIRIEEKDDVGYLTPEGFGGKGGWLIRNFAPFPRDDGAVAKNATTEKPAPTPLPPPMEANFTLDIAWDYGHSQEVTVIDGCEVREPMSCPPGIGGIWDYCGCGYRVEWIGDRFVATAIHDGGEIDPWIDGGFWTQIEPAPHNPKNGPIMRRPKMRTRLDSIKTPWDPYGEGE